MHKKAKFRLIMDISLGMVFAVGMGQLSNLLAGDGFLIPAASYTAVAVGIVLYLKKSGAAPLQYLKLHWNGFGDIASGLLLGVGMALVQQIPLLFMGFDYRLLAREPQWPQMLIMGLFCILFVGTVEELLMRGFILQKSRELTGSNVGAVAINCLLFYVYHCPPIPFVFGQFFNLCLNTVILSVFFLRSKQQSLLSLMLAHGVYDIVVVLILPAAAYSFL